MSLQLHLHERKLFPISTSAKIIPCVLCAPCVWRPGRRNANRESGRNIGSTSRPDFASPSAIRPDAIRTRTPTSCASWLRPDCVWCSSITSWLPLIYDSSVPTASGPPLLRSDCVGSTTLPFLLLRVLRYCVLTASDLWLSRPDAGSFSANVRASLIFRSRVLMFSHPADLVRIPRFASLPSWRLLTSSWSYTLYMPRPDPIVTLSDAAFSSGRIVYLV